MFSISRVKGVAENVCVYAHCHMVVFQMDFISLGFTSLGLAFRLGSEQMTLRNSSWKFVGLPGTIRNPSVVCFRVAVSPICSLIFWGMQSRPFESIFR